MKIRRYTGMIILLTLIITLSGCIKKENINSNEPLSRTEFLMDTVMTVKIYDNQSEKTLDKIFSRLKEIEDRMSATIETSDVNKINENAGIKAITVNSDTYFVIKEAKNYAELSNGAYDPTIGPLVDLWDIKSGEKERESIPTLEEIEEKKALINYNDLELLDNNQVFLNRKNMKINLGGIVKGYAADEVRKILTENKVNAAIIDLGGNVFAHGIKADGSNWKIGVQNPLEYTGGYLGILQLKNKSIVTSGNYERFFIYNENRYHHILDAKTGYPSENELMGVTIVSDRSIDGDALSTTLFVLGLDGGMELISTIEGAEAVFITKDKSIYMTPGLKDMFISSSGGSSFSVKEY